MGRWQERRMKKTLGVEHRSNVYAFMLHQLSVYFSENVDSTLTHGEFMSFWVKETVTAMASGKYISDPDKPEKIINVLPKT